MTCMCNAAFIADERLTEWSRALRKGPGHGNFQSYEIFVNLRQVDQIVSAFIKYIVHVHVHVTLNGRLVMPRTAVSPTENPGYAGDL